MSFPLSPAAMKEDLDARIDRDVTFHPTTNITEYQAAYK